MVRMILPRSSSVVETYEKSPVSNPSDTQKLDKIMKTFTALMAASALAFSGAAATGIVAPAPAKADPPSWAPTHGKRAKERARSQSRIYDSRGRYVQPRRIGRDDRVWRGDAGQYYCRRDNGTTGLVIGAGVGALAGSEIAGRGDRTLGAILGGVAGGLLGRELDRGSLQCR